MKFPLAAALVCILSSSASLVAATETNLPPPTTTEPATFARFVPERADDFAWENDLIAFRAYGPALRAGKEDSGIDCWLKRVPYPIIDRWYAANNKGLPYHQDHGEGYDPYHVGSSRGTGGLALWVDGKMVTSDTFIAHRVLEQTKEKTVFELDYEYPAAAGEIPVKETKHFTITLGEPFYQVSSTFTLDGKPLAGLPVAIGITTHDGKAKVTFDPAKRWMSCWEVIDGYGLGTGVVLGKGFEADFQELPKSGPDTGHALAVTKTNADGVVSYWGGYGWEHAGHFNTAADWETTLTKKSK
jgi:hypothetical protein